MIVAADVVAAARTYVGVPFRHQGRTRKEGLDCAGLVIRVAHDLHLSDFDLRAYDRVPDGAQLRALCDQHLDRVLEPAPGAVALMRFARMPQHLAIIGDLPHGGLSLIHGAMQFGRVVEHGIDALWRRRILLLYRMPGVA